MDKRQIMEQFRKAVQLFAASLDEETALEIATVHPEWKSGSSYKTGDYVTFLVNKVGDPQLYKVVQAHTSQDDWLPPDTPSLYTPIGLDKNGYPTWSQPTGAHDAYNKDDIVDYNGTLYKSLVDGNVWAPGTVANVWEVYNQTIQQ